MSSLPPPWQGSGSPASTSKSPRRTPRPKRTSIPAGQRLSMINEGQPAMSVSSLPSRSPKSFSRPFSFRDSAETLPPQYTKYNYAPAGPTEAEKASQQSVNHRIARRGGWGRLWVLLAFVLCVAIALGVGLGVGLTHQKSSASSSAASETDPSSAPSSAAPLGFPIGTYSLNTALRSVQTNCTSNPSTWRCFPYSIYSNGSSSDSSLTSFNWVIANTSATYVTNSSLPSTNALGISANLSVSTSNNPFSISFNNQPLVYLNDNARPRFQFNYTMSQQTIPTTALTSDNSASICKYNDTLLTGTLYLSDSLIPDYPAANSTAGSYQTWPFAVKVEQVANGGENVPACYKTNNGVPGEMITGSLTQEPSSAQCLCDYRNYEAF